MILDNDSGRDAHESGRLTVDFTSGVTIEKAREFTENLRKKFPEMTIEVTWQADESSERVSL